MMKHSDMTFARIEEVTADGVSARLSTEPDDVSGYMLAAGGGAVVGGKCVVVQTPHGSSYIIPVSSTPGGGAGLSIKSVVVDLAALNALAGSKDGDTHLVKATGDLYVFSGGVWHDLGHVVGPQGAPGAASTVPGPAGAPGADGHDGAAGAQGVEGARGTALHVKGVVTTVAELQHLKGAKEGDVHYVSSTGDLHVFSGTGVPQYAPGHAKGVLAGASWYVDACALTKGKDGLKDLSGGGNDLVFAHQHEPVVLPHAGDDYVWFTTGNRALYKGGAKSTDVNVPVGGQLRVDFATHSALPGGTANILASSAGGNLGLANISYVLRVRSTSASGVHYHDVAGLRLSTDTRYRVVLEYLTATTVRVVVNGTDHGVIIIEQPSNIPANFIAGYQGVSLYSSGVYAADASPIVVFDPSNANADQTLIHNTGSAGDDWTVSRAATGLKTVVVDRPKLLFGGALAAATASAVAGTGTRMDLNGPTLAKAVHDGRAVTITGDHELSAAAVFDHVLSAAEVTEASAALQDSYCTAATRAPDHFTWHDLGHIEGPQGAPGPASTVPGPQGDPGYAGAAGRSITVTKALTAPPGPTLGDIWIDAAP